MELNDSFGMLLFFSLFAIIGGAAVGAGLRNIVRGNLGGLFFLVWGAGFGGIPLIIGAANFLTAGQPIYFYAQLFVFVLPLITVALMPDDLLAAGREPNSAEGAAIVSAVMTMIGGTVVVLTMQNGLSFLLLLGGFFAVLGAVLLIVTTIRVLRAL